MQRFGLLTGREYYAKYIGYIPDTHHSGRGASIQGVYWHDEHQSGHMIRIKDEMFMAEPACDAITTALYRRIIDYFDSKYATEFTQLRDCGYCCRHQPCLYKTTYTKYWYILEANNLPNIEICFESTYEAHRIYIGGGRLVDNFAAIWQHLPTICKNYGAILRENTELNLKYTKQCEKMQRMQAILDADYAHFNQFIHVDSE